MTTVALPIAIPTLAEAIAIIIGAISGSLYARRQHLDVMGIIVIGFVGALGGGVIRDILLVSGPPVFLTSPIYLGYAMIGAGLGFVFAALMSRGQFVYDVVDTLFIGVWVLVGATKAMAVGLSGWSAVLVAVITATGGGVLRDLMCGQPVALLRPGTWLAAAAGVGALTFVGVYSITGSVLIAELLTLAVSAVVRAVSWVFDLRTPMPVDLSAYLGVAPVRSSR